MKNLVRLFFAPLVAVMCVLPVTGCSSATQAQVNTAVADIQKWAPVVTADVTALASDIASFDPADAASINSFVATLQADAPQIQTLCSAYLAAPSASLLTQIASLISTLSTTDAQALLSVLAIKSPTSQLIAKGILTTLATAFTIIAGLTANWNTTSQIHVSPTTVATLRQYVDRGVIATALAQAQDQGLVTRNMTVEGILNLEQARGL